MSDSFGDKVHPPTPRRRQEARQQGQVAKSHELASACVLVAAFLVLVFFAHNIIAYFGTFAHEQLSTFPRLDLDRSSAVDRWNQTVFPIAIVLLPVLGGLFAIAILSHVVQTGFLFLPQKLSPDASRVNPWSGITRIVSADVIFRIAFASLKIGIVLFVAGAIVWPQREQLVQLSALPVSEIARYFSDEGMWLCVKIAGVLLALAIVDYGYQRWKHERDLRMTDQELREEIRQSQVDPQLSIRRRQTRQQLNSSLR